MFRVTSSSVPIWHTPDKRQSPGLRHTTGEADRNPVLPCTALRCLLISAPNSPTDPARLQRCLFLIISRIIEGGPE